jgi:ABC-2 type transport system ATP-binding protein
MSVEIRQITKLFGKQKALDNVSFEVNKGELVGFLGPNGAGKSTLMKIITGFLSADAGDVFVEGEKTGPKNLEIRKNIGYLPEHNPLYTDLYVREFLEITAGLYKLKNVKTRVSEMVELTGLGNEQHKKIRALSKGYRQRVGLAQALIHNPPVLILDEPTTGLDPNQIGEIRQLISNISREKTVIISSHIMQEVEAICNRVIIINHGKVVADGGIDEIRNISLNQQQLVIAEFTSFVDPDKIRALHGVRQVVSKNNIYEIESDGITDIRPVIFQFAVNQQLTLITLHEKQQNLEKIFQQVTQV